MKKSIRLAVLIPTIVALVIGTLLQAGIIAVYTFDFTKKEEVALMCETSRSYVKDFEAISIAANSIGMTLRQTVTEMVGKENARERLVEIIGNVVSANPIVTGIGCAFAPNAFDGLDAQYVKNPGDPKSGANDYRDHTGRFLPYIYRNQDGTFGVETIGDYDDPIKGEWYFRAERDKVPFVLDPYYYLVNGRTVLMYTVVSPILDSEGNHLGMMGVDIDVQKVIDKMSAANLLGAGYMVVTDSKGRIIAHKDKSLLMTDYRNLPIGMYASELDKLFQEGTVTNANQDVHIESDELSEYIVAKGASIDVLDGGQHWLVMGIVPRSRVLQLPINLLGLIAAFSILQILLVAALVYVIVRKQLKSIPMLQAVAHEMATGNLDVDIAIESENELGRLGASLSTMAINLKAYIENMNSIEYASKIQRNLLPPNSEFANAFSDYSIIWEPKDIVGGDIYWLRNFDEGSVLCVCDCTGHGTPGALLTMLVASAFQTSVTIKNFNNPAAIMWELEKKLVRALNVDSEEKPEGEKRAVIDFNDGCDLAVLFIAKNGTVKFAAGNTHVFICDGTQVSQHKGQKIRIGDGELTSVDDVVVTTIEPNSDNKFYIASDGLYDQVGESGKKFGYRTLKSIILENHNESQAVISDKIWRAFEENRGNEKRRDDVELVTFKPFLSQSEG